MLRTVWIGPFVAVGLWALAGASSARACPVGLTVQVDNDVAGSGYSETNVHNWASRPTGSCYGGTYRYLSYDSTVAPNNDGTRTGKAIWTPAITVEGYYEVETSFRATSSRTTDADYWLYGDQGSPQHVVVDQTQGSDCTYVTLGTIFCTVGGACRLELDGTDDGHSDAADVTRFTLTSCTGTVPPGDCSGIQNHPNYELCQQSATTCAGVFTNGDGCDLFCAAAGMVCVARYGGEPGCQQEPNTPIPCSAVNGHASDWCDCALPPGQDAGVPDAAISDAGAPDTAVASDAEPPVDGTTSTPDGAATDANPALDSGPDDDADPAGQPSARSGCTCRTGERGGLPILLLLAWLLWMRRRRP